MAELSESDRTLLEKSLSEHMMAYAKSSTATSVSHGNDASNTSTSFRVLSPVELRSKIDELRKLLGMEPMFEGMNQLRPFAPGNYC